MALLNKQEIEERLNLLADWQLQAESIERSFVFGDFAESMSFVNRVAAAAESANHHPDIEIRWNKVRLALSSHDAGGLTKRDFQLAKTIDGLVERLPG